MPYLATAPYTDGMSREPMFTGEPAPSPGDDDQGLRPQRLRDMVGQSSVRERIEIAVEAATKRNEALGHVLFDGPPGLGKTTFALCIPKELGVKVQLSSGAILKAPKDLLTFLTNLEERSVLFIDEIHRMPRAVEEYLYTAMEDFRIDILLGEGVNARTINYSLKPFTLIGATTRAGMLSGPLRDRFQIREHLGFYGIEELTDIVRRNAARLQVEIAEEAALEIARRGRGTPRVAINHLRWSRDYADSRAGGQITLDAALKALEMAGVDSAGLMRLDRNYLDVIMRMHGGGPVGVESIAHTLNVASDTLSDEIEPYLLRAGFVVRTPRGRMATEQAYLHLKLEPPPPASGGQKSLF